MLSCKDRTVTNNELVYVTKKYLDLYPEIVCWKNTHILHSVAACSGLIFLIFSGLISALFFFDGTGQFNSANSKKSSIGNAFLIIYETIVCLAFSFLLEDTFRPVLIVLFLIGGIIIFYYVYY